MRHFFTRRDELQRMAPHAAAAAAAAHDDDDDAMGSE